MFYTIKTKKRNEFKNSYVYGGKTLKKMTHQKWGESEHLLFFFYFLTHSFIFLIRLYTFAYFSTKEQEN